MANDSTFFLMHLPLQQILAGISPTPVTVDIVDNSDGLCDGGAKLEVFVVSDAFDKLPPLVRV